MNRFFRYWFPLILYCMAIISVSVAFTPPASIARTIGDKPLHFMEYGLLALLATRALRSGAGLRRQWAWLAAVAFCFAVGGVDELVQHLNPARKSEWLDLAADVAGGLAGATLYVALKLLQGRVAGTKRAGKASGN
ncbi:MAG: VanZ family protein [Deltaproteobacteria bacterium]|nr:MAG: VanZ family protein [Deltaproteobacteria bacterium]